MHKKFTTKAHRASFTLRTTGLPCGIISKITISTHQCHTQIDKKCVWNKSVKVQCFSSMSTDGWLNPYFPGPALLLVSLLQPLWLVFVALASDLPPAHLHFLFMIILLSLAELNWALFIYLGSMAKFSIEFLSCKL